MRKKSTPSQSAASKLGGSFWRAKISHSLWARRTCEWGQVVNGSCPEAFFFFFHLMYIRLKSVWRLHERCIKYHTIKYLTGVSECLACFSRCNKLCTTVFALPFCELIQVRNLLLFFSHSCVIGFPHRSALNQAFCWSCCCLILRLSLLLTLLACCKASLMQHVITWPILWLCIVFLLLLVDLQMQSFQLLYNADGH